MKVLMRTENRCTKLGLLAGVLGGLGVVVSGPAARADELEPFVPNEVVVRLQPGVSAQLFAGDFGVSVLASISSRNVHRLSLPVGLTEEEFIDAIESDPRLLGTELNFIANDRNPDGNTQSIFILEREAEYAGQAAMSVIRADAARSTALGAGVLVAVIDSGVDSQHPALVGRMPFGGVDLIAGGVVAPDVGDGIDNDGDGLIDETVGHGTLVAGLVARIAPEAWLLPVRALDSDGVCTTFRLADGIYWSLDLGAAVINISMSTVSPSAVLEQAVAEAVAAGVLVVSAAGNDGTDESRYPASFGLPGVLSVAGTTAADRLAPFSSFGFGVSLTAPGDPVVGPVPGGSYGSARGTSFAAPIVAGAAAMVRSIAPGLSAELVAERLMQTSVPIDSLNPDVAGSIGAGRVDVAEAVGATGAALGGLADLNGDAMVDSADLALFDLSPRDLDMDGRITARDRELLSSFVANLAVPCSPADFAAPVGVIDVFDILGYFSIFAGGTARADLDRDGRVGIFDVIAFFTAYRSGC